MTDFEMLLRRVGDEIHELGNSHSTEYWHIGNTLDAIADRYVQTTTTSSKLIDWCEKKASEAYGSVEAEPYETAVAILRDNTIDGACAGCGRFNGLDVDGYCWSCRELYDRKPEDI